MAGHASLETPPLPPLMTAMVRDHIQWVIGPAQRGIGLGGVSILLTDFYTVCRGCGSPAAFGLTGLSVMIITACITCRSI